MTPIRFYFDFTSTFSYIAVHQIDEIAAKYGRTVDWRAVSLGHLFQAQGVAPPPTVPAKFAYLSIDFPRSCAFAGLPCRMPEPFPPEVKIARLAFWHLKARDEQLSHRFARAIVRAIFGRGEVVATAEQIMAASAGVAGLTLDDIAAAAADSAARQAVIASLEHAKADGVFGAPFMILDGEPFWGADRLPQLEARLANPG
jgi:2-hydroxychromene-2-carboxylate isomerase